MADFVPDTCSGNCQFYVRGRQYHVCVGNLSVDLGLREDKEDKEDKPVPPWNCPRRPGQGTPDRRVLLPEETAERYELWREGYSQAEIARAVGAHPSAITLWMQRKGLPPNFSKASYRNPPKFAPENRVDEQCRMCRFVKYNKRKAYCDALTHMLGMITECSFFKHKERDKSAQTSFAQ